MFGQFKYDICRGSPNIAIYFYISCGPYVFFKVFSNYKSMRAIDPHVLDKFSPKGLDWQDLCWGPLNILNILAITSWVGDH